MFGWVPSLCKITSKYLWCDFSFISLMFRIDISGWGAVFHKVTQGPRFTRSCGCLSPGDFEISEGFLYVSSSENLQVRVGFFYTLGLEFLYSNFFHISMATPSGKKKQKEKNSTKQKGQRCLHILFEGKWLVSVGEYNVTLVLVQRVRSVESCHLSQRSIQRGPY